MSETVVVVAGDFEEARRFVLAELGPEDKPVIIADGRHVYHLHGLTPDRVVRLRGFYSRDDRGYIDAALLPIERTLGVVR